MNHGVFDGMASLPALPHHSLVHFLATIPHHSLVHFLATIPNRSLALFIDEISLTFSVRAACSRCAFDLADAQA